MPKEEQNGHIFKQDFRSLEEEKAMEELDIIIERSIDKNKDGGRSWNSIYGLYNSKERLENLILGSEPITTEQLSYKAKSKGKKDCGRIFMLYGPEKCGKTHLVDALAYKMPGYTYFRFESILELFTKRKVDGFTRLLEKAKKHVKAIVLLKGFDRIDQCSKEERHGAMKALEEFTKISSEGSVFVFGVTSYPWHLNDSIWKIFPTRIFVPLPESEARKGIWRHFVSPLFEDELIIERLARESDRFSYDGIGRITQKCLQLKPMYRSTVSLAIQNTLTEFPDRAKQMGWQVPQGSTSEEMSMTSSEEKHDKCQLLDDLNKLMTSVEMKAFRVDTRILRAYNQYGGFYGGDKNLDEAECKNIKKFETKVEDYDGKETSWKKMLNICCLTTWTTLAECCLCCFEMF